MDWYKLRQWFYNFMEKHKINQTQLSEKLGVSHSYISSRIRGKSYLNPKLIDKMVTIFGINATDYKFLQQYTMSEKKRLAKRVDELEQENQELKQKTKVSGNQQIKNYVIDNLYLKLQLKDYLRFIKFLDKLEG